MASPKRRSLSTRVLRLVRMAQLTSRRFHDVLEIEQQIHPDLESYTVERPPLLSPAKGQTSGP